MEIVFDPEKAARNPLEHEGVTFEEAQEVLFDPYALTREDIPTALTRFDSFRPGKPINPNGNAMNTSSDEMYEKFKDDDFADAQPVSAFPHLRRLQAEASGKTRITIRLDNDVLEWFRAQVEQVGGNYQTLINEALRTYIRNQDLEHLLRRVIREELQA